MNFVAPAPTLQVSPVSRRTRARRSAAICAGGPNSRTAPATSRNASSIESGSTTGVTSWKIRITSAEASRYFS